MASAAKAGTKHGAEEDHNAGAKRLKAENGAPAAAPDAHPNRPKDWPAADNRLPIDLDVQDRPHKSSDTEWWYINTHFRITKAAKAGAKSPRAKSPKAAAKSPKSKSPKAGKGKKAAAAAAAAAADDSAMTDDAKDVKADGAAAAAAAAQPVNLHHGEAPAADGSADIPMVGRELSAFASFFRLTRSRDPVTAEAVKVHSLTWAVVDPTAKVYYADPYLDVATPEVVAETIKKGSYSVDGRMRKAFLEVCEKGNVPLPDRKMPHAAHCALDKLELDYCGQTLTKDENGNYLLHCEQPERKLSLTLKLVPKKKAVRQGNDGVVKIGLKAETMFYYFIPRLAATGTVTIDGKTWEVEGNAWYDHEFGSADGKDKSIPDPNAKADVGVQLPGTAVSANGNGNGNGNGAYSGSAKDEKIVIQPKDKAAAAAAAPAAKKEKETSYAWNWLSLQLDDGTDVTATLLIDPKAKEVLDNFAITIGPNSERTEYRDGVTIKPLNNWQSVRTTFDYPTKWALQVPAAKLDVVAEAAFEDQEFITLIARPAFWEGRMHITGTYQGKPIRGVGFLERQGFEDMSSLDYFFKKISKQVLKEIEILLPLQPNTQQIQTLMANDKNKHLMDGVNNEVFKKTITQPLREIIDRGGKSWRSFSMLLCLDAVGGYSPRYKHWLAMPEIMHVGSLIVDDIQDKSETRRGGPSCHRVHGEPVAINAGTAAYFMSLDMLQKMTPWMTKDDRLEMYDLFFLTLRGGHAGQAFDIYGLDYMMDEVVEKGAGPLLEQRVKCTHRLKSAVPAGNLARMGALAGGGTPAQVQGLGDYLESIGVAFQIIDDVLNLRGFAGNTKTRGEDIMAGKITYPVAKAMTLIKSQAERKRVWDIIKSKPQDHKVVEALCDDLERIGAIEGCVDESAAMVEDAWRKLDAVVPDSFYKMLLRSFGWYVLQRHY